MKFNQSIFFKILSAVVIFSGLFLSACNQDEKKQNDNKKQIVIGYQKFGSLLYVKEHQLLEKTFEKEGVEVKWVEFTSGPPMLEALNAGKVDIANTGEAPPIFAQSGGVNLVYIAYDTPSSKSEAIIVPQDTSIHSVSDLKGKKVAVTKGSSAHFTLLAALKKNNLSFADITPVYLQPLDARAAYESKKVDAWAIWDPFLASAQVQLHARILVDTAGLKSNSIFYLSSSGFSQQHPDWMNTFLKVVNNASKQIQADKQLLVKPTINATGLPQVVAELAVDRRNYGLNYFDADMIKEQQSIADIFYEQKLIPNAIDVSKIVWQPKDSSSL